MSDQKYWTHVVRCQSAEGKRDWLDVYAHGERVVRAVRNDLRTSARKIEEMPAYYGHAVMIVRTNERSP